MRILVYDERDSFLHRLNPLTKLAFASLILLGLTAIIDPVTPLLVSILLLVTIWRLGQIGWRQLARHLVAVVMLGFGLLWTTTLFYLPDPAQPLHRLFALGPAVVTDQGLAYGLTIMFRLFGFYAASICFVLTTDPTDLVQSLIQQLKLSDRLGYGVHAGYRFLPLFETELDTIRAAHRVRGVEQQGGLLAAYRRFSGYLVPLLAGSVRTAERVALAMDARGFCAWPTRTYYRRAKFGREDVAFVIGAILVLGGLMLALSRLGWLGQLVPPFVRWI
jgi:energy-coupling factor transport system permease protein